MRDGSVKTGLVPVTGSGSAGVAGAEGFTGVALTAGSGVARANIMKHSRERLRLRKNVFIPFY
jgi:hypothetical protein